MKRKDLLLQELQWLRRDMWAATKRIARMTGEEDRDPRIMETLFEVMAALDVLMALLETEKSAATGAGA